MLISDKLFLCDLDESGQERELELQRTSGAVVDGQSPLSSPPP